MRSNKNLHCVPPPSLFVCEHEIFEDVPVVDASGTVVETRKVSRFVSASEVLDKYTIEDFRISNLKAAGVPLDVVNIHPNILDNIDTAEKVMNNLEYLENLAKAKEIERSEIASFFNQPDFDTSKSE